MTVATFCVDEYVEQCEQYWQGHRFVSFSCEPNTSVYQDQDYFSQLFVVIMNRQIAMEK